MIVAAGAFESHSHEHGADGHHAIDDVADVDFLFDRSTFAGGDVTAVETGGNQLIRCRVGKQIPSDLFDHKLVVRLIPVQCPHHPIPVGPHLAIVVQVQSMGIAVAGRVQPEPRHVLAVTRGTQQPIDDLFVGIRRFVGQKCIDLVRRGWQPGQIQRDPAQQRDAIGLG